jgi:TctA family transporter
MVKHDISEWNIIPFGISGDIMDLINGVQNVFAVNCLCFLFQGRRGVLPGRSANVQFSPVTMRLVLRARYHIAGLYRSYVWRVNGILVNIPGEAASVVTRVDGFR